MLTSKYPPRREIINKEIKIPFFVLEITAEAKQITMPPIQATRLVVLLD